MPVIKNRQIIRAGILGCSDIARRRFIPALLKSQTARLAALASRNIDHIPALADTVKADILTCQELVEHPSVDLIYISLPNHLHEQWSIKALEQGKHIICEKPLGLSADSVTRMLDAADAHEVLLYENLMYLNHPQHAVVTTLINEGRIGRILSLECVFTFPAPQKSNFRMNPAMGGGAFHDLNRYPLSAARYFLKGEKYLLLDGKVDDMDGLNYSMKVHSVTDHGENFSFLIAFGQPYQSFYEIIGEKGKIRVERAFTTPADMENRVAVNLKDTGDASFNVPPCDHFLSTIEHVSRLIHSGNWRKEHDSTRRVAKLADMINNQCRMEA